MVVAGSMVPLAPFDMAWTGWTGWTEYMPSSQRANEGGGAGRRQKRIAKGGGGGKGIGGGRVEWLACRRGMVDGWMAEDRMSGWTADGDG
jgi:hypothetical protein